MITLNLSTPMQSSSSQNNISVILPVYRDIELTRECLNRCLSAIIAEEGRLILINDASPEAGMQAMLDEFKAQHPHIITLINNQQNKGFTASVNTGLQVAKGDDIVLLNSDVLTPRNWLQILRKEASRNKHVGTITPLSNNSTITSIPKRNLGSDQFLRYDVDIINQAFELELPLVITPTGIGFCMFINAQCVARVGKLDVKNFGKGYGEENDFCQRALKAGFLNALTPNLYCHHIGSVSFGKSTQSRIEKAYHTLHKLHPNYHLDVASWIARDQLAPARILRTLQISKQVGRAIVLHINHSLGGGTTKYVNSLLSSSSHEILHIVLNGRRHEKDHLTITFDWPGQGAFEEIGVSDNQDALLFLGALGVDCVHIHHLVGVPREIIDWTQDDNSPPHIITFHDYYLINGNPILANSKGEYVGIEASPLDSPLHKIYSHPFHYESWPDESKRLIQSSSCNIFPSDDTYQHYLQAFTTIPNAQIIAHDNANALTCDRNQHGKQAGDTERYQVVALGALSREKGADFIEKTARASKLIKNSLEFKIIGFAYRNLKFVDQLGAYRDEDLQKLIRVNFSDCIFFANRWPETYSYTLSEAMCSGLPIVAPQIGSFPERLRNHPCCLLYDPKISPRELASEIRNFLDRTATKNKSLNSLEVNKFYKTDYIAMINHLRCADKFPDPAVVFAIASKSLPTRRYRKAIRGRILNLILILYRHPLASLPARLLPFGLIRQLKEWIYPWPIQADR